MWLSRTCGQRDHRCELRVGSVGSTKATISQSGWGTGRALVGDGAGTEGRGPKAAASIVPRVRGSHC
jgi:hypothetical protein